MSLIDALQGLATLPRDVSLTFLAKECDPAFELRRLDAAVTELNVAAAALRPPDPARIERLMVRFRKAGQRLDGFEPGEVRLLAWNNEMILNPVFRSQLADRVREGVVRPNLLILAQVYFGNWGQHSEQHVFEQMLRILADRQSGFTPTLQLYKQNAQLIFSASADDFLSRLVVSSDASVTSILEKWSVSTSSSLSAAVLTAYIRQELAEFKNGKLDRLDNLLRTLQLPIVPLATYQAAAGTLILAPATERNEVVRKQLELFVLDHPRLGDPRLPQNAPNWTGVDPEAQRKFRTWRATKNLVFFFNSVLPEGRDPHGRKDFWLRYVDQVMDSVVALCPSDRQRLRASLSMERVHHCRVQENQAVSCFLMRFKGTKEDFVVAEFSNVGKARIFYYGAFLERVGNMNRSEFRLRELKSEEGLAIGFSHIGDWQGKVRNTLAQIGIRAR